MTPVLPRTLLTSGSFLILFVVACLSASCTSHRVGIDPIEIKPIRVTVDVNVQVQRKLDDFFDFEDELVTTDESKSSSKEEE